MAITFLTNEDEKRFVKQVNGQTPDENGNVQIEIPEGGQNLPQVTEADAGKFLRVSADGTWAAEALADVSEVGA